MDPLVTGADGEALLLSQATADSLPALPRMFYVNKLAMALVLNCKDELKARLGDVPAFLAAAGSSVIWLKGPPPSFETPTAGWEEVEAPRLPACAPRASWPSP